MKPKDMSEVMLLMAEAVIRITAIERLLIAKGIVTESEISEETRLVNQRILDHYNKTGSSESPFDLPLSHEVKTPDRSKN